MVDQKILDLIRQSAPANLARDIVSVQPIPSDAISKLREASKSKAELIAEGYEPVSKLGLMYIKKENSPL